MRLREDVLPVTYVSRGGEIKEWRTPIRHAREPPMSLGIRSSLSFHGQVHPFAKHMLDCVTNLRTIQTLLQLANVK